MTAAFKRPKAQRAAVRGVVARAPRPTLWALAYFAIAFALPVLAVGALLDAGLVWIWREAFDSCFLVYCLLE